MYSIGNLLGKCNRLQYLSLGFCHGIVQFVSVGIALYTAHARLKPQAASYARIIHTFLLSG